MGYIEKKMEQRVNITNIIPVKGRKSKLHEKHSNLVEVDVDDMSDEERFKHLTQQLAKKEEEEDVMVSAKVSPGINFDSMIKTVSESSL